MKHTILITGVAGYVGGMLVEQLAKRDDVERIIGIDKEPCPVALAEQEKVVYIQHNLADIGWEDQAVKYKPTEIIHAAWQIRELYGKEELVRHWNIDGSDRVFDFAITQPTVTRLVHFSTVASYGAFADNTMDHFFTEDEPLRESCYSYAEEKRIAEEHLHAKYDAAVRAGLHVPQVSIVRPASITGPKGRARTKFSLQSALSGSLRGRGFIGNLVSLLLVWMPVTKHWLRQYIHEDEIIDTVTLLTLGERSAGLFYEAFNIAPPGPVVTGKDMATLVSKHTVSVYPHIIAVVFFFAWHLTRGRIPTAPGSWRGYTYPIAVDGSKITKLLGYIYKFSAKDAFSLNEGRYEAL